MKTLRLNRERVAAATVCGRTRLPRRQQGVVLFIALIVLVAMTLAGIAMVRSVDTTLGIAGNVAFRQVALQSSDSAVQAAFTWLSANGGTTVLQNDNAANGFYSSLADPLPPGWFDLANWGGSAVLNGGNPDANGNVVRYLIHRMCTQPSLPYTDVTNQCSLYFPTSGGGSGGTMKVAGTYFEGIPQLYYRVTTRVDGPRNTVSITQTSILIQ